MIKVSTVTIMDTVGGALDADRRPLFNSRIIESQLSEKS